MTRIAVIGAGVAGSECARSLHGAGADVVLFDKGRGPGGRCSTRRVLTNGVEVSFDHGAQYFTIRDESNAALVEDWIRAGAVARWRALIGTLERGTLAAEGRDREGSFGSGTDNSSPAPPPIRYVGTPGMSAIVKALQRDLDVRFGCRIRHIEADGSSWRLRAGPGQDPDHRFDAVVVTAPPAQAAELLQPAAPRLAAQVGTARLAPCWATMVHFDDRVRFAGPHTLTEAAVAEVGGLFVRDSPLSWVASQRTKPGRADVEHWVLHASAEWSAAHLEQDPAEVGRLMLEAFEDATQTTPPVVLHQTSHRWRYASVATPGHTPFLWSDRRIAVCGDWCVGGRVEGAILSGRALAEHLTAALG